MPKIDNLTNREPKQNPLEDTKVCFHCGTNCFTDSIKLGDKYFCCDGCQLVYDLLQQNGLCDYYKLQQHPGLTKIKPIATEKFAYLDNDEIAHKLLSFSDGNRCIVTFYLPAIHCASCMWLLEHLHQINPAITESRVNFSAKEITVHYCCQLVSLRSIAELLSTIGYEPYISLNDEQKKKTPFGNKQMLYKLGIAGFCFGNIMMMSFPEYLSTATGIEPKYSFLFRYLNLLLALPVFFYCASAFFVNAWKGLQQKILNIDAPIALAIIITFARSVYEILWSSGAGYLDSMSGIVFFMLVGRVLQEKTYQSISFHRDYKSYFPIAVRVVTDSGVQSTALNDLKKDDVLVVQHEEIIPADAVVLSGNALIDYSFVTGESEPVAVACGKIAYAGGKQIGGIINLRVTKPVAGSYLTELWNHNSFKTDKAAKNDRQSTIHLLSKYFTIVLFSLAFFTGCWWAIKDPGQIINSVSAMLIVACPCALLLSATFTNGNILRLLSNNGLYLRDSTVIEQLADTTHIVFDKTGTLTDGVNSLRWEEQSYRETELDMLFSAAACSKHPKSQALVHLLGRRHTLKMDEWTEIPGYGVIATFGSVEVRIGSAPHVGLRHQHRDAALYTAVNGTTAQLVDAPALREGAKAALSKLNRQYQLSLLSGDNSRHEGIVLPLFQTRERLYFDQKPQDKLAYVEQLQRNGQHVLMVGDGLNDAGALQQSNVGITLADDINNFTPACDAILDATKLSQLPALLKLALAGKRLIWLSFAISIIYNVIGLAFAIQGTLQPITAAILMPCSTITIVLIATACSRLAAAALGLKISQTNNIT